MIRCGVRADFCPGVGAPTAGQVCYYLFKYDPEATVRPALPEMTGEDLKLSGTRQDFDPQSGQPIVLMQFTGKGEKKFHDITRAEAQRGRQLFNTARRRGDPRNYVQNFAIVLDNELITAPVDRLRAEPGRHRRRQGAQITGIGIGARGEEHRARASRPVRCRSSSVTLSETEISATLGEDSLQGGRGAPRSSA